MDFSESLLLRRILLILMAVALFDSDNLSHNNRLSFLKSPHLFFFCTQLNLQNAVIDPVFFILLLLVK